jgi:hypothetical protein
MAALKFGANWRDGRQIYVLDKNYQFFDELTTSHQLTNVVILFNFSIKCFVLRDDSRVPRN